MTKAETLARVRIAIEHLELAKSNLKCAAIALHDAAQSTSAETAADLAAQVHEELVSVRIVRAHLGSS